MKHHHFNPHATRPQPCIQCTHFGGWSPVIVAGKKLEGTSAICNRFNQVQAQPQFGCAHWVREPERGSQG